jgi:hypothetical protein
MLTLAANLVVASTRPLRAQSSAYSVAAWRWTGTVPIGGTIEIDLVRGSVRAEATAGRKVVITLVRRGEHSDPAEVQLAVDTTNGVIHIQDRYPMVGPVTLRHDCLPPIDRRGDFWHSDVRLDAVVQVPADVRLVVQLMDGGIDVRRVSGPRDVRTNQGAVLGAEHRR